ncbi:MAG: ATP-binding protein [Anaerolineae bacterium]|jgi:two-component system phosphate regulon sensor histidine kinase PhoR
MFQSLRWRIAVPYVALILVATLGVTVYISDQVREVRLADLESQLLAEARLLAGSVAPLLRGGTSPETLDKLVRDWAAPLEARVTIIGADGVVLGESHEDRVQMDNHLSRPEVQLALRSGQGSSMRYSATMGYEMMYAAVPIPASEGPPLGVMRVALPLGEIQANVGRLRQEIVGAGLVTALAAALLAVFIAGRVTRPVRQLTEVADRMAEGDLDARLFPTSRDEVGQLTQAFNHMADRIREQVGSLAEERGRLAAVLDHMADGVLITDDTGQVQLVNAAAARLLDTSEEQATGRTFAQVAPYYPLIELWKECREQSEEQVGTVEVSLQDLFLQAIVTPFGYAQDRSFEEADSEGYLVILQDLTRIRRLETVRRDFISNISHELRTPLAGLKALVDTLRGGAIKDRPAAKRFLKRMDAEVDTLTQMVEELLELSRIESGLAPLRLAPTPISEVVILPVDRLRPQAERAGLEFTVRPLPEVPEILADVERARQVLTNLVHNAVKFTPPGGRVTVAARPEGDEVVFSVRDTGVGIPADDLPRIFERFYKADQARSGGGTGLGLAIAKHVVQGHGGRIWAESIEGQGSTFYFTLPVSVER